MNTETFVFWYTGLSGAGKTTIANAVKNELEILNNSILVLDGDDIRSNRKKMLGFSEKEIKLNNLQIAQLCKENAGKYDIILVPIISPYQESRQVAREIIGPLFFEVFISSSLETVVKRDTKGLYAKAREGALINMIGYSPGAVYEEPEKPDFILDTQSVDVETATKKLCNYIEGCISKKGANI
jgi:adenylyl-sulfate kinase